MAKNKETVKIGEAVAALKEGKRIARVVWGEYIWLFMQIDSIQPLERVAEMTSLPNHVKKAFIEIGEEIRYYDQVARVIHVTGQPPQISSWSPSIVDVFADDWLILD